MALSNDGISKVRKDVEDVGSQAKNLSQSSSGLLDTLKHDGNYQYFKNGTDKGNSVDSALTQTLTTITDQLAPAIAALKAAISAFLARQEAENRRRAQEQALRERETAAKSTVKVAQANPILRNRNIDIVK